MCAKKKLLVIFINKPLGNFPSPRLVQKKYRPVQKFPIIATPTICHKNCETRTLCHLIQCLLQNWNSPLPDAAFPDLAQHWTTGRGDSGYLWARKTLKTDCSFNVLAVQWSVNYFLALNFPIFQTRVAGEQQWDRQLQVVMLLSKRTKYI